MKIELEVLDISLSIAKVKDDINLLHEVKDAKFISFTRTDEEISLVVDSDQLPNHDYVNSGWRALRIAGPLDFSLVGVLQSIIEPLAKNGISIFSISTFDTDYILVRQEQLQTAVELLSDEFVVR